jgi:hypothetical protein
MKASELRIGNLVDLIGVAVEITANHIKDISEGDSIYKAIPLTEEWLVKLGFKERRYSMCAPVYGNEIIELANDFSITYNGGRRVQIKYVHQLQNLYFALTGTELEIKALV